MENPETYTPFDIFENTEKLHKLSEDTYDLFQQPYSHFGKKKQNFKVLVITASPSKKRFTGKGKYRKFA